MPVTTPIAKLIRKILPQNFAARRYTGLRVRTQAVSMIAMKNAMPIVIGTKRKW